MKHLRTVDQIVRELGGNKKLAGMIQCTPANITSWLNNGRIPAKYYFCLVHVLEARGCEAPRKLWSFEPICIDADAA